MPPAAQTDPAEQQEPVGVAGVDLTRSGRGSFVYRLNTFPDPWKDLEVATRLIWEPNTGA